MKFLEAVCGCHVRSAIYRRSVPEHLWWKNHPLPLSCRVPVADQRAEDWEEYDPRDDDRPVRQEKKAAVYLAALKKGFWLLLRVSCLALLVPAFSLAVQLIRCANEGAVIVGFELLLPIAIAAFFLSKSLITELWLERYHGHGRGQ
jgi:hypothetical protein